MLLAAAATHVGKRVADTLLSLPKVESSSRKSGKTSSTAGDVDTSDRATN
jgi:hypothetical protein